VAPGSVNALMTLPKGDIQSAAAPALSGSFAARLHQMIEKRRVK
jgi:flagellar protein FliO/FliZ